MTTQPYVPPSPLDDLPKLLALLREILTEQQAQTRLLKEIRQNLKGW